MKHRGLSIYTGEWITGWLMLYPSPFDTKEIIYSIKNESLTKDYDVRKETLSIETLKLDSNGNMIFASFELDGKMTIGGDVFRPENGDSFFDVVLQYGRFFATARSFDSKHRLGVNWEQFSEHTITGKQSEAVNANN